MKIEFNPVFLTPINSSEGIPCWFDPTLVVPVRDETNPEYGKTYQEIHNISDADVIIINKQAKWDQIRHYRDKELKNSDWTQGADVPAYIKTPWAEYRSQLRDLPAQSDNPEDIEFPEKPN